MKFAPAEMLRMIAVFFMVMILLNFGIIEFKLNQANDYESAVSQKIAKEGCVDKKVVDWANNLSKNTQNGIFSIKPAPTEKLAKKDVNGKDETTKVTFDYSQPQNYGQPIKYIMSINITPFALGAKDWSTLPHFTNTHEGMITSQLAQHDVNKQQQQF